MEFSRHVRSALEEGRNVMVADTHTYSMEKQDDELRHIGNAEIQNPAQ